MIRNYIESMLMNTPKKINKITSIKALYSEIKEAFGTRKSARYWFGNLLALTQQISLPEMKFDYNQQQKQNLIIILNYALTDMMSFYQKQPPEQVYHLLQIIHHIINGNETDKLDNNDTYKILMQKLYVYNIIGIFLIKNRQYCFSQQYFEQVLTIYNCGKIETSSEIFLSVFNNYLCLMKASNNQSVEKTKLNLLQLLEKLLRQLSQRYLKQLPSEQSVLLLLSVYKQHQIFMKQQTKSLCMKLMKKFTEQQKPKDKSRVHRSSSKILQTQADEHVDGHALKMLLKQNKSKKITSIKIKNKEVGFYLRIKNKISKETNRLRQIRQSRNMRGIQIQPFQHSDMLQISKKQDLSNNISQSKVLGKNKFQSLFTSQNLQSQQKANNKQRVNSISAIQIPQPSVQLKVESKLSEFIEEQQQKIFQLIRRPSIIKNACVLIKFVSEGMVLENYLGQKQKFIDWQEVATFLKYLKMSVIFLEALPLSTEYQLAKIFSIYLQKRQPTFENKKTIMLSSTPKQLISLNQIVKLYKQEGNFVKIFLMNAYDNQFTDLTFDCYIDDFEHYFRKVKQNDYIEWLNQFILMKNDKNHSHQNKLLKKQQFSQEMYRKNKEVSKDQIFNQLKVDDVRDLQQFKSSPFRVQMVMKNQKRLLVYVDDKILQKQDNAEKAPIIVLKIVDMNQTDNKKKIQSLNITFSKFSRYFPIPKAIPKKESMRKILQSHGKIILYAHMHCFLDYPKSFFIKQNMVITTFSKKVEMIKQGRYYAPISAELIGNEHRFFGILFREFEQSQINENITFVYNQEHDLLKDIHLLKDVQLRKKILLRFLDGTIQKSLEILKKKNLKGKMVGIFQYLQCLSQNQRKQKNEYQR